MQRSQVSHARAALIISTAIYLSDRPTHSAGAQHHQYFDSQERVKKPPGVSRIGVTKLPYEPGCMDKINGLVLFYTNAGSLIN